MFKKIQIILMVCILFIGILPSLGLEAKAADPVTIDGFSYKLTEDGQGVIITGYDDDISSIPVIPSEIAEKPVVEIGDTAFWYSDITQITIPNSVTSIGNHSFYEATELTNITIPNSVTSIDSSAFRGASGLKSITLSNSLKSIGDLAFSRATGLKSLEIPNSVTSIGNSAFENTTGLTSITLPDGLESIGISTFEGATGLNSIEIPSSVKSIGWSAFEDATGLTSLEIPNSVTSIGNYAFRGASGLTSITLSNSLKSIGYNVFEGTTGLTSITLPDGLERIGFSVFSGTTTLASVIIPNSVTSIDTSAFEDAVGLTSLEIPNSVTSIGNYTFRGATGLKSLEIPDSVTSIGWSAFEDATGLTSITLPNSLESIKSSTFKGATGLTNITIPNSVTSIGSLAFLGATGLTNIEIPENVKSIGDSAFSGATGLISIEIPKNVKSIGDLAFSEMTGLTSIKFHTPLTTLDEDVFKNVPNGLKVIGFKDTKVEDYVEVGNWHIPGKYVFEGVEYETTANDFGYELTEDRQGVIITGYNEAMSLKPKIPNKIKDTPVVAIEESVFYNSKITQITVPNSVTSIGNYAFRGATGLTSITLPTSLENIGEAAFYDATGLTSIEIPDSVKSIGDYAFRGATGLTSIEIPNSVKNIGYATFSRATGLTNITLPTSLESIDGAAFYNATGLKSIEIPDSVTSIGDEAFSGATGLTSIKLPSSLASIGNSAFAGATGLTSIEIPENVENIEYAAFSGATALTSIKFNSPLIILGEDLFEDIPNGLKVIGFKNTKLEEYFKIGNEYSPGKYIFEGAEYETVANNFNYELTEDRQGFIITGYDNVSLTPKIPNEINNKPVVGIGGGAFFESEITQITIPSSVKSIGYAAFSGATGLTSITLPTSLESIGDSAFAGATGLTSIEIPDSVKSIGYGAFSEATGLTSITLPNGLESIGDSAFYDATGLTSIEIPDSVMSIGDSAFRGTTGLTSITLPDGLESIGSYAFSEATGLTSIKLPTSLESIGNYVFSGMTGLTSIEIPNSVTWIGYEAFSGATSLKTIKFNSPLTTLEEDVFSDVPNGLKVIGFKGSALEEYIKEANEYEPGKFTFEALNKQVTFNSDGGTKVASVHTNEKKLITEPKVPTKANHRFEGWYTDSKYKTKWDFNKVVEKDLTLYAKWSINKQVTFNSDGGTKIASVYAGYKKPITEPKVPIKANHVFEGWYTDKDHKTKWDFKKVVEKDLTLYAKWSINKQVTFNSDGGTKIASVYAGYKKPITEPKVPTKANHVFEGWYTDKDHKTKWDFNKVVEKDLTLYAKWSINKQVTFNSNGGTKIASVYAGYKKVIAQPKAPTKANHVFEGWYTDAKYKVKWDFKTIVEKDLTLYAKWSYIAPAITLKNSTISDATVQVTGTTSPNSVVRIVQGSKKIGEGKSDTKGNFTIKFSKVKANSTVEIQVTDAYDNKKSFKKTVADKTAPKVTVPKVNSANTKIVGTAEAKSKIELVINKKVTKATTSAKGNYSISIKKQKAGTKMTLTVSDAAGNKTKKTITVLAAPKPVTVASISDKQDTITGKTEAKAKVVIYVNDKSVKTVTANSKGNYSYKVGKKKAGTSIKVIATDQAGNATTKTVKVLDKTAPAKPSVKSIKASSTTVVGKAEAKSTVYVYKGKTLLGKATTSSKGNYTVKIKKQKKGTTLLVKAQDKAKNTSKNTSIKVK